MQMQMQIQHLLIRMEQVLALAMASHCARSQHAALVLDPIDNVVLIDSFNAPASMGREDSDRVGVLCAGHWCRRDGLSEDELKIYANSLHHRVDVAHRAQPVGAPPLATALTIDAAEEKAKELVEAHPKLGVGNSEIGCLCAERRALFYAARRGISCQGRWMICTGSPCLACAKAIVAADMGKVVTIADSYEDSRGIEFLKRHGVPVETWTLEQIRQKGRELRKMKRGTA